MRCILPTKFIGRNFRHHNVILMLIWCFGLFLGALAAGNAGDFSSMMHAYPSERVSIVRLILIPVFPLLLSAAAVYLSYLWLLPIIVFFKAACFGFCLSAVTAAFGSAGFLLRFLLLFTDMLTIPALCWYWLRHGDGNRANWLKDGIYCGIWFACAAVIDYTFVCSVLKAIL